MISIALSGCMTSAVQHPPQGAVRKILQLSDDYEGEGPAGILKGRIKIDELDQAKTSFFYNQYGFGINLDWNTTILCIILKKRSPTPLSPIDVMNNIPGILIDGDRAIEKSINESWVVDSWKLIDVAISPSQSN
jgi:hypothetical protein